MAEKTNEIAFALKLQPTQGSFDTPTSDDRMPISNLQPQIVGVTIENDEYTGSPIRNGAAVVGKRMALAFNVKLRPPGGADVPEADEFKLGRIFKAAKLTEVIVDTAIPASAEAVASGTTTSATLGSGAAATANLYKGLAIQLQALGAALKQQMTAVRAYSAGKVATLFETHGSSIGSNYQIPKQIAYTRSITSDDPPLLSIQTWWGGDRWDLVDCRVTGFRIPVPVSTKDQAAWVNAEVTLDCMIHAVTAEAAPSVPSAGPVPFFKDGKQWLANKKVGGSNFTVDLGITAENPPNPNQQDGSDPAELTQSIASLALTRQKYAKNVFDAMSYADAQSYHGFMAAWGSTSGNMVVVSVPDARFNYSNPDLGGAFVMENDTLYIDALDRGVCIAFPYGTALA